MTTRHRLIMKKDPIWNRKKKRKSWKSQFTHPHVALNPYDWLSSLDTKHWINIGVLSGTASFSFWSHFRETNLSNCTLRTSFLNQMHSYLLFEPDLTNLTKKLKQFPQLHLRTSDICAYFINILRIASNYFFWIVTFCPYNQYFASIISILLEYSKQ